MTLKKESEFCHEFELGLVTFLFWTHNPYKLVAFFFFFLINGGKKQATAPTITSHTYKTGVIRHTAGDEMGLWHFADIAQVTQQAGKETEGKARPSRFSLGPCPLHPGCLTGAGEVSEAVAEHQAPSSLSRRGQRGTLCHLTQRVLSPAAPSEDRPGQS